MIRPKVLLGVGNELLKFYTNCAIGNIHLDTNWHLVRMDEQCGDSQGGLYSVKG